jgi:hypothetical protein
LALSSCNKEESANYQRNDKRIRSINLKPSTREEFHRLYIEEALPLLKRWNFDVVAITAGTKVHRLNA